jgi:hypothetical protein
VTELAKAIGATAAVAGLAVVGLVFWIFGLECCPHEGGDE